MKWVANSLPLKLSSHFVLFLKISQVAVKIAETGSICHLSNLAFVHLGSDPKGVALPSLTPPPTTISPQAQSLLRDAPEITARSMELTAIQQRRKDSAAFYVPDNLT